jgi:hypothetical protein
MALTTIWCCLLQRDVLRVSNREDEIVAVVCPDYQVTTGLCHLKTTALREELPLEFHGRRQQSFTDGAAVRCRFA